MQECVGSFSGSGFRVSVQCLGFRVSGFRVGVGRQSTAFFRDLRVPDLPDVTLARTMD